MRARIIRDWEDGVPLALMRERYSLSESSLSRYCWEQTGIRRRAGRRRKAGMPKHFETVMAERSKEPPTTFERIGKMLGITRQAAHQIYKHGLAASGVRRGARKR